MEWAEDLSILQGINNIENPPLLGEGLEAEATERATVIGVKPVPAFATDPGEGILGGSPGHGLPRSFNLIPRRAA